MRDSTSPPPFRADQVGSLLRPPELLKARQQHAAGELSSDRLRAVEDDSISRAIKMQESAGLPCATDGEFRRTSWHMDFLSSIDGIAFGKPDHKAEWHTDEGVQTIDPPGLDIVDRVRLGETIFGDAFEFLRDHVTTAVPKLTIPAPNIIANHAGGTSVPESIYPDMDDFWTDLSAAYAEELKRLVDLGCTYLQLDDTSFSHLGDPALRANMPGREGTAEERLTRYINNNNRALADRPDTLAVTTHLCHGNFRGMWLSEGGYDFVAEQLFNELNVDGFFLEFDDERSGTFEPLRFVPSDKRVVLGLVTTKQAKLEDPDELKRRIDEAARYIDLDQLCLSPQCGFASTEEGNPLTESEQVAKLELIVNVATDVWGST